MNIVGGVGNIGGAAEAAGTISPNHKFFERGALENFYSEINIANYGMRKSLPKNSSGTMVWNKFNIVAANTTPLTEGVTPVGQDMSLTRIEASVNQYGGYYVLTDRLLDEGPSEAFMQAAEQCGKQAALTEIQIIYAILQGGTNVRYAAGVAGTANVDTPISAADVDYCVSALRTEHARRLTEIGKGSTNTDTVTTFAGYFGFFHEDQKGQIEALDDGNGNTYKPVSQYAAHQTPEPGEIGTYKEVRFILDTDIPFEAGAGFGGKDVYKGLIIGKDAFGVVHIDDKNFKIITKGLGEGEDALNQRASQGWKMTMTAKILYDLHMIRLENSLS